MKSNTRKRSPKPDCAFSPVHLGDSSVDTEPSSSEGTRGPTCTPAGIDHGKRKTLKLKECYLKWYNSKIPDVTFGRLVTLEQDLAARFENIESIEVDTTIQVPFAAWVLNKCKDDNNQNETRRLYQVKKVSKGAVPEDFKVLWTKAVEHEETANDALLGASIAFLLQKVELGMSCLRFRYREGKIQWYNYEERERAADTESDTFIPAEESNLFNIAMTSERHLGKVVEEVQTQGENFDDDKSLFMSRVGLHINDFCDHMLSAYIHHMKNSKGRRFIRNLLEVAAQMALGIKGQEYSVFDVGPSNNRSEGLPVRKRKVEVTMWQDENLDQSLDSASDLNLQQNTPTVSSPTSSVSTESSSSSARGASMHKTGGYIYPDCVVAARDESAFSRYLIVADLKSGGGRLSDGEISKLYQAMIGAGAHQTEVFGILVNAAESLIVRMERNNETGEILFLESSYDFTIAKKESFNLQEFGNFFKDLLVVTSYAMENIKAQT